MELKKQNKKSLKKIGAAALVGILVFGVALTVGLSVGGVQEVSNVALAFSLPMNDAVIIKDYNENALQFNETLNRWEIHLAVDLSSTDSDVFSIADGVVSSVDYNSLDGYTIMIEHSDGFKSVYSSLSSTLNVSEGDKVSSGQKVGTADESAANEADTGAHLHLTMYLNGEEVDPNNYLDLQNK